ncbi:MULTISPECIES: tRNA (cytidine(34)-2'-O)-methyltransferase [unclassified Uliginosibacterium]|uniref:tRNA (cytidine(34)-2'-O)-methyltransferase n=1 Tax=unclassified Uliginosibacterium TaxID=2621521 RepID=UPI000C7D5358|nr:MULTISPECIES: tRNA (cytidine(34)-2'-O)-methyltransferase [unclassified Uliginosibacterium]MDO6386940.1 tRNA (cytidine(34)-2'-O)-methyltransferase [Uliginosibacterium sp. 31-12]PLK49624.1 tRNA (uridine(34)/cytosine(34)/5-carboxymethylaminomethyluridine(34)-2'-O)-methyltransferase TrmL [Uliginosibacterium sp. TH139]
MIDIVLFEPEIPPNTGNIIRLCANTGARLHLVEPMGFELSDKQLQRAGMDYTELSVVTQYPDWAACRAKLAGRRFFALSTRGTVRYDTVAFQPGDVLVFGPESRGLPAEVLAEFAAEQRLRLPMMPNVRSVNLSNTVAVVTYEAWRQLGFAGGL